MTSKSRANASYGTVTKNYFPSVWLTGVTSKKAVGALRIE